MRSLGAALSHLTTDGNEVLSPAIPLAEYASALQPAEGSAEHLRDVAYWREVLHRAPALVEIPSRSRAAAPAGFGLNRGPLGQYRVSVTIGAVDDGLEAIFLSAFARALGAWAQKDAVLLERHTLDRVAGPLLGPCTTSYPVVVSGTTGPASATLRRVAAALEYLPGHLSLDTPAIEGLLGTELRARNVSLRQFGFGLLDLDGESDTAADYASDVEWHPFAVTANELQLVAIRRRQDVVLNLIVDTAAVEPAQAHIVLKAILAELSALSPGSSGTSVENSARWSLLVNAAETTVRASKAERTANVRRDDELPLTNRQFALLGVICRSDADASFNRYWMQQRSMRVTPSLDLERLRRALDELARRHEATRTRFVIGDDGTPRAFLLDKPLPILSVEDVADEEAAVARAQVLAGKAIDPFSESLFQVALLRYGIGDVVVAKGHHAVMDGYSIGLMVEDMVQLYLGLSLAPVGLTTREYIARFDLSHAPAAIARRDAYLAEVYADPLPHLPALGALGPWRDTNPPRTTPDGELTVQLDNTQRAALRQKAMTGGVTVPTLLMAALSHTIAHAGRVREVILTVPQAMRTHKELASYVNFVTKSCLVRCSANDPSVEDTARSIASALARQVDCASHEHVRWHGSLHDRLVTAGSYTDRYLAGMLTADRWQHGAVSSPMQRLGGMDEVDLGLARVKPLTGSISDKGTLNDLRVQTFEGQDRSGIRFGYSKAAIDEATAGSLLGDVLDRLGLPNLQAKSIVF
jgi:hypothetical protein